MLLRVGCRQVLDQADGVDQRVVKHLPQRRVSSKHLYGLTATQMYV